MNEPKKHHFVPETYLKEFENYEIKKLFRIKLKGKYLTSKIKRFNRSQICYIENYYQISNCHSLEKLQISDQFFLEKVVLKKFEDNFGRIIEFIKGKSSSLTLQDATQLIDGLLLMKVRNPVHRDFLSSDSDSKIKESIDEYIKEEVYQKIRFFTTIVMYCLNFF